MNIKRLLKVIGVAVLLALIWTTFFTVDETIVAVVTRFGKPLESVRGPGLHFKLPWPVDKVIPVDTRLLFLEGAPQELLTFDQKNVVVGGFFVWNVIDPKKFVRTVKTRALAEERLKDIYESRMGALIGGHSMHDFISLKKSEVKFHSVSNNVKEEVNTISRDSIGVNVFDLRITGFTLPQQNRASVIARMSAERATIAAKYRSEGEEKALRIEGEAEAKHNLILGEAHAEAEAIRGKGEAEALKIFSAAYSEDPEFYRFIRSLESYEAIINRETTLFLESDSKLLKVLDGE